MTNYHLTIEQAKEMTDYIKDLGAAADPSFMNVLDPVRNVTNLKTVAEIATSDTAGEYFLTLAAKSGEIISGDLHIIDATVTAASSQLYFRYVAL